MTMTFFKRLVLTIVCVSPLVACSQGGDFSYVSRKDLASEPLYLVGAPSYKRGTTYGAIMFREKDANQGEGRLFVISRNKGIYQAETMLKKTESVKYYFSLGIDYKQKTPAVGFRMEF